jgi:hypothetical protein
MRPLDIALDIACDILAGIILTATILTLISLAGMVA